MNESSMPRRDFLRAAGVAAGGALGGRVVRGRAPERGFAPTATRREKTALRIPKGSLLDVQPSDAPIDTIVVLMMENRSFDHYLGWLGDDSSYLDQGRSRYGKRFRVDARNDFRYLDPEGRRHHTHHLVRGSAEPHPYRGCGHPIPGHGWFAGRRELAEGFLAEGSGNDTYALGYYLRGDVPVHGHLADRFTVLDRSFASLCAGTFPNRQYAFTAQSGGEREDPGPLLPGMFATETIFEHLMAAGVPIGSYHVDIPLLLLWGERFAPVIHSLDTYFEQCAAGELPRVVFISPGFEGDLRTDDHSQGDVRLGQRFIREVFNAFAQSPHWEHGLFVATYDEWGGFFDHVRPPLLPDDRAGADLALSFGLAGFRVPTILASPYAKPGFVDHTVYDHTSILRFLEWRFLGAPARGPGADDAHWFLTTRDRHANNLGASLGATHPEPELGYDTNIKIGPYSLSCEGVPALVAPSRADLEHSDPFEVHPDLAALLARDYAHASHTPWFDA